MTKKEKMITEGDIPKVWKDKISGHVVKPARPVRVTKLRKVRVRRRRKK